MIRFIISPLFIFCGVISTLAQPVTLKTAPGKLIKLFESAQDELANNNHQEAIEILMDALDKEEDFIDRARNPRINSRLGCQCILAEGGSGTIDVTLPDQSLIHGD